MELPKEIEWNIIKFMSHETADVMRPCIEQFRHGFANEFYFEEGLDHSLKHFHLVILNAIRNSRYPDCDCWCKRWHDCQCWCSKCGSEYPVCRASCYQ